jgi:hypothetical protein
MGAVMGAGLIPPAFVQGTPATPRQPNGRPQNLILFFTDEMRTDALACYGNPVTQTPNFDRLAREGALFQECHVQTRSARNRAAHRLADQRARPSQPLFPAAAR